MERSFLAARPHIACVMFSLFALHPMNVDCREGRAQPECRTDDTPRQVQEPVRFGKEHIKLANAQVLSMVAARAR